MKFRDITKRPPKGKVNLLTGKAVKNNHKKAKASFKSSHTSKYELIPLSLEIDDEDDRNVEGIAGLIKKLPDDLKLIVNNGNLVKTTASQGYTFYKLDNGISLKLTETVRSGQHKTHVVIKKGKKTLINQFI